MLQSNICWNFKSRSYNEFVLVQ